MSLSFRFVGKHLPCRWDTNNDKTELICMIIFSSHTCSVMYSPKDRLLSGATRIDRDRFLVAAKRDQGNNGMISNPRRIADRIFLCMRFK